MAHPGHIDHDSLMRRISEVAADLQRRTEGLFRDPYRLEHRIVPSHVGNTHPTVTVVFLLSMNGNDVGDGAPYTAVVYGLEYGPLGEVLTASCTDVYSSMGHMVGSFLFLLQYRLAMELHTLLFSMDNMTTDWNRGARGIYSMLIYQHELDVDMNEMNEDGWKTVQDTYMSHRIPSHNSGPEMIGIPYPSNEESRHAVAILWNEALTRIHDRVVNEDVDTPWKPKATVTRIMNAFMLPSRMVSSRMPKRTGGFSSFSIDMTSKRSKRSRRSTRSKQSKRSKSMKRALGVTLGGAQGAPLDQAFTGVVLPSDLYRPILKPMHGGDGFAYQAPANLGAPAVYAPTKARRGRRRSVKRSVKRKGKARGLAPGHALPQGFGQMVQSFRPL